MSRRQSAPLAAQLYEERISESAVQFVPTAEPPLAQNQLMAFAPGARLSEKLSPDEVAPL